MSKIEIGKKAPAFALEGTGGKWRLADAAGGPVVIYFYPRDNTPGCTQEGVAFAALYREYKKAKTSIVERRIEQLVQEAEGLGWNTPGSPRYVVNPTQRPLIEQDQLRLPAGRN